MAGAFFVSSIRAIKISIANKLPTKCLQTAILLAFSLNGVQEAESSNLSTQTQKRSETTRVSGLFVMFWKSEKWPFLAGIFDLLPTKLPTSLQLVGDGPKVLEIS